MTTRRKQFQRVTAFGGRLRARVRGLPRRWVATFFAVVSLAVVALVVRRVLGTTPVGTSAAATTAAADSTHTAPPTTSGGKTRVSMRNVNFFVDPEIALHIRHLDGTMHSVAGGPIIFDDKRSFTIRIEDAEVGLTASGLSSLLNKYVFAYPGSPLKHLSIAISGNEIVQRGTLHKGVDLPFEITATLDVTPEGLIRLHPTKTKILGVNGAKVMKLFGLSLEKLLDLRGAKGASVHGNDLFLVPDSILPPPAIEGRVVAVRLEGDEVVQRFGSSGDGPARKAIVPPDLKSPNYMFYKGGTLRFGK
ncbi:MAG: hypothetical protein ABJD07_15165, partial [Gemmatimonadaceae bacterium]